MDYKRAYQIVLKKVEEIEQNEERLANALSGLLDRYIATASSGDCGFWDYDTDPEVVEARKALRESDHFPV